MGPIKVQQDDCLEARDSEQSSPKEEDSPQSIIEGHEDDEEDSSFNQLTEALTNHFYYSNGVLRPKLHSNAILLHSRSQII